MSREDRSSGLLRNRDYLTLLGGQTVSSLGSAMSGLVFTLLALAITGSPVQAGLVGAARAFGATAASLPAGALVDRWNRKRVLVSCGAAGTVMYASVMAAILTHQLTIAHLVAVSLCTGVARAFFIPAAKASLRHLVPQEDLGTALAANEGREHLAALVGAPLGGALFSVARALPVAVDAATYAVMTMLLVTMRHPLPAPRVTQHEPILPAIRTGLRWLFRQRALRTIAVVATFLNFCVNAIVMVLVIDLTQRGVHAGVIGLLETGVGIGGLLGALFAPMMVRRLTTGRIAVLSAWVITVTFAATASTADPALLIPLLAVGVFMIPAFNSGLFGYQVIVTPDHIQGRAQSAMTFMASSTTAFAPLAGGFLIQHGGAGVAILELGVGLLLGSVILTISRPIREIPLLADVIPVPDGDCAAR